jgi:hypothetical protein
MSSWLREHPFLSFTMSSRTALRVTEVTATQGGDSASLKLFSKGYYVRFSFRPGVHNAAMAFIRTKRVKKNGKVYEYQVRQHSVRIGRRVKSIHCGMVSRAKDEKETVFKKIGGFINANFKYEPGEREADRMQQKQDEWLVAQTAAAPSKTIAAPVAEPASAAEPSQENAPSIGGGEASE